MNYWQIIYYTGKEDYETKEMIITAEQYKQVQEAITNGEDYIVIKGKPTFKRNQIASINEADDIVAEYKRNGTLNLIFPKAGDLPEPDEELEKEEKERKRSSKERGMKNLGEWVKKQSWYRTEAQEEK
jgi:hypothetical protein